MLRVSKADVNLVLPEYRYTDLVKERQFVTAIWGSWKEQITAESCTEHMEEKFRIH